MSVCVEVFQCPEVLISLTGVVTGGFSFFHLNVGFQSLVLILLGMGPSIFCYLFSKGNVKNFKDSIFNEGLNIRKTFVFKNFYKKST